MDNIKEEFLLNKIQKLELTNLELIEKIEQQQNQIQRLENQIFIILKKINEKNEIF